MYPDKITRISPTTQVNVNTVAFVFNASIQFVLPPDIYVPKSPKYFFSLLVSLQKRPYVTDYRRAAQLQEFSGVL